MSITVAEARIALDQLKKDISDVSTATFLTWCNYINRRAYRMLVDVDPEQYISSSTISVVSGTDTYSLPATFDNMRPLGCGLFEQDSEGNPIPDLSTLTRFKNATAGHYVTAAGVVFTPKPTTSKTYTIRFIPTLSDLTGDASIFVIPDQFEENLVQALDVLYSVWDEDNGYEPIADQRYMRSLSEMIENYRKEPQTYLLPDFSTIF